MKETLETTTNSSVYNKLYLKKYGNLGCYYCYIRSGGYRYGGCDGPRRSTMRNWKHYRKTQYKIVEKNYGTKN